MGDKQSIGGNVRLYVPPPNLLSFLNRGITQRVVPRRVVGRKRPREQESSCLLRLPTALFMKIMTMAIGSWSEMTSCACVSSALHATLVENGDTIWRQLSTARFPDLLALRALLSDPKKSWKVLLQRRLKQRFRSHEIKPAVVATLDQYIFSVLVFLRDRKSGRLTLQWSWSGTALAEALPQYDCYVGDSYALRFVLPPSDATRMLFKEFKEENNFSTHVLVTDRKTAKSATLYNQSRRSGTPEDEGKCAWIGDGEHRYWNVPCRHSEGGVYPEPTDIFTVEFKQTGDLFDARLMGKPMGRNYDTFEPMSLDDYLELFQLSCKFE